MADSKTKIGHGLAKVLGIKLESKTPFQDSATRGATKSFIEQPPTTAQYFQELTPNGAEVLGYIKSLFPFLSWIGKYNVQWLIGDLVAGTSPPFTPSTNLV